MSKTYDVVVLVGSLRKESLNRKMANALTAISPATLKLDIVEIGQLPHYNQDLEADLPQEYIAFRQRIAAADALLFITPEYNRSVPGVLKNAIDVASRPSGKSVWNGKPAGVINITGSAASISPGSNASQPAPSAPSAPIIICARRWWRSTFRRWHTRKRMSVTAPKCSTSRDNSLQTRVPSWTSSCRLLRAGSNATRLSCVAVAFQLRSIRVLVE